MTPILFIALVLAGAVLLIVALTIGPRNNALLGVLLVLGVLLLLGPLAWILIGQMRTAPPMPAPPAAPAQR